MEKSAVSVPGSIPDNSNKNERTYPTIRQILPTTLAAARDDIRAGLTEIPVYSSSLGVMDSMYSAIVYTFVPSGASVHS